MGLDDVADALPGRVSGGQMQRASIVRAVAHEPALVLADEPTGALDAKTSEAVLSLLLDVIREQGRGLVLVSHDEAVASAADRRLVMLDGALTRWTAAWT